MTVELRIPRGRTDTLALVDPQGRVVANGFWAAPPCSGSRFSPVDSAASRSESRSPVHQGRSPSRSPVRRRVDGAEEATASTIAIWRDPDTLKGRSFTRVSDWSADELRTALDLADELKVERARRRELRILPGRTVGLIFRKPSTAPDQLRVGIAELGGWRSTCPRPTSSCARGVDARHRARPLALPERDHDPHVRPGRGRRVRGARHDPDRQRPDRHVPPLQALADAMTIRERFGTLEGIRVAYLGDGNNVCHSLMRIAARTGMRLVAASPDGYLADPAVVDSCREDASATGGSIEVVVDPAEAVAGARVLYTDVWTSMGQEDEQERRLHHLAPYRIDGEKLASAAADAVALHRLPAHVGRRYHRRRPLRRPLPRLGPGREPPARL